MSEAFKDRLARLRREGGSATGVQPGHAQPPQVERSPLSPTPQAEQQADAEPPAWWRTRMARRGPPSIDGPASTRALGPPSELIDLANERGAFAARITRVALEHAHGATTLADVLEVRSELFALVAKDARLAALDPRRALFLDIETTGLSGGAGTKAFLVGLGSIEGAEFVLWQGFLRGPEQEAALLHEVAARIARCSSLVTFFGKSFDRHRLEDKMRVHGVQPPFEGRAHLDLYHPLRALYRPALADARLGTLERALCCVERDDDLSGAFAPEAWHDFLADRPHRLERVFAHNRDDVLSLVTLCAHLGRLELAPQPAMKSDVGSRELEAARLRGLARALAHHKRWSECAALASDAARIAAQGAAREELLALAQTATRRAQRSTRRRLS